MPKYPNITVSLTKYKNNEFMLMRSCINALNKHSLGHKIEQFISETNFHTRAQIIEIAKNWFTVI